MELSTAISDFILCVSSFGTAVSILPITMLGAFGFLIMSVAAGFGTARFSMSQVSEHIVSCHASMSWLAGTLGLALMAAGFYRKYGSRILATAHVGLPLAYTVLKFFIEFDAVVDTALTKFISSTAVLSIGIYSLIQKNPFGMMGAFCYMLSGVMGTTGELLGIKRVDWFHYILAFGGVVLMRAYHFELPVEKEKTS